MRNSPAEPELQESVASLVSQDSAKLSRLCAWLAAAMPLLFALAGLIAFILFVIASRSGEAGVPLLELWAQMPLLGKLAFLVTPLIAWVGCTVLLALAGYGRRVSTVLLMGLAALPWISGAACTLLFSRNVAEAFQAIDSGNGNSIGMIAAGLAEALVTRLVGSFQAGLFLAACAIGLGVAAIGQRPAGRRLIALVWLLGSSLPVLVFVPAWVLYAKLGGAGLLPVLMAAGIVVAAILVGSGAGGSSPDRGSWPLGAGALVSAGLAFLAAAACCSAWSTMNLFANMASVGSANAATIHADAAALALAIDVLRIGGGALALLPAVVFVILAFLNTKIKSAWIAGAAACVVLMAGTLMLDQFTAKAGPRLVQEIVRQTPPRPAGGGSPDPRALDVPVPTSTPPTPDDAGEPGQFQAPTEIPGEIDDGVVGGVPGGVPGGVIGGVPGGQGNGSTQAPASGEAKGSPPAPVRVGGGIPAPKLITRVPPAYPPLAKAAQVQGVVVLEAVIDPTGHVARVKVLHGHPLLDSAAIEAVSQWIYEPVLLQGKPIPVILTVTVRFTLSTGG